MSHIWCLISRNSFSLALSFPSLMSGRGFTSFPLLWHCPKVTKALAHSKAISPTAHPYRAKEGRCFLLRTDLFRNTTAKRRLGTACMIGGAALCPVSHCCGMGRACIATCNPIFAAMNVIPFRTPCKRRMMV